MEWQKERLQYLEREASSRKELQSWEARFIETQRRADWLQEQLDSNSREKTELFKQADQFQQLLLQKERSLQKILEEKQELAATIAPAGRTGYLRNFRVRNSTSC